MTFFIMQGYTYISCEYAWLVRDAPLDIKGEGRKLGLVKFFFFLAMWVKIFFLWPCGSIFYIFLAMWVKICFSLAMWVNFFPLSFPTEVYIHKHNRKYTTRKNPSLRAAGERGSMFHVSICV